jgi:hypothetical protein
VLILVCLPFAVGDFHDAATAGGGDKKELPWILIGIVLAVAIVSAVVMLVPRVRRLLAEKARPHLVTHLARRASYFASKLQPSAVNGWAGAQFPARRPPRSFTKL